MRISRDSLSPNLVDLLSAWTVTFQTTAAAFLAQPSVISEPFSRVCELHNTLLLLEQSKQPTTVLEVLRESEDDDGDDTATLKRKSVDPQNDAVRQAQELLGFMLNAEFVLFELYREYAIRMNPSLSHWVTVSRDFDRWYKANTGPDGQPVGEWGVKEKVFKIRVAFVKGILAEQGPKVYPTISIYSSFYHLQTPHSSHKSLPTTAPLAASTSPSTCTRSTQPSASKASTTLTPRSPLHPTRPFSRPPPMNPATLPPQASLPTPNPPLTAHPPHKISSR